MDQAPETASAAHPVDLLIAELRALREHAASSYAEVALRITHRRIDAGLSEAAARVSRSTIYDAFQLGRRRLNADLVAEIVVALGVDEATAEEWRQRCIRAKSGAPVLLPPGVGDHDDPEVEERARERVVIPCVRAVPALLIACTLLNFFGGWLVMVMRLPLYLDMIGTAISSVILGPWWGALVGVCTNGGEVLYDGNASLPFAVVNVVGALVWGYGVRRFAMGRTLPRFFLLNAVAALACTFVAVPILLLHFHGVTRNAVANQTLSLDELYHSLVVAVWSSDALTSLVDKAICGVGVVLAASTLPVSFTTRLPATWALGDRAMLSARLPLRAALAR